MIASLRCVARRPRRLDATSRTTGQ
jgi:hypothetical protein